VNIIQLRLLPYFVLLLASFLSSINLKAYQSIVDHMVNKDMSVLSVSTLKSLLNVYEQFNRSIDQLKFNLSGGVKP